ncbi:Trk system potassium transporter TrkA [Geminicoccus harenae]|uniref:Trk system potassium transporter TrkA n=1 Tax=Geminicoccus harenae TaxID=2498453 RepID=UPI00168AF292|nr:Trk system potassium transporter TrkA [Geminicoccus harenae]
MRVIVAGAGRVGESIARYLVRASHEVTVIDQRPELVQRIAETVDLRAITGSASHPAVLREAGAANADLLVAVTRSDEVNIVACQVANALFNTATRIARIRQQAYLDRRWEDLFLRQHLAVDVVISPEIEVARSVARTLLVPGSLAVIPFASDRVRLVSVRCDADCPILDTPLRQLSFLFPDLHVVVVAIERNDRLFVPHAEDLLIAGDRAWIVVETKQQARAMTAFGHAPYQGRRVVIGGAGSIGSFLVHELRVLAPHLRLAVVENAPERAGALAEGAPGLIVLQGDARDPDLLREAGVATADTFVTVTNQDEVNIMSALMAKRLGANRTLALINTESYAPLIGDIGIDVMIDPRGTTVSSILQHVRRGRILAGFSIKDGAAEAIEADLPENSPLVGKTLDKARMPQGVIIGAVLRGGQYMVPRPDTQLRARDRLIAIARGDQMRSLEQAVAVRFDYL